MDERTSEAGTAVKEPRGSAPRTRVSLACSECDARNYKTTRKPERVGQLSLKKFCPTCKRHTLHKETK